MVVVCLVEESVWDEMEDGHGGVPQRLGMFHKYLYTFD